MNTPLVIEYLRTHSIVDLFANHGVRMSPSRTRTYKASLNYDQIAAKSADRLAQQCRGLVLATRDGSPIPTDGPCGDLQVLAWPMSRFFNHGQGAAHKFTDEDLAHPDARVYEKLDGTLCIVYFDSHAWHCISGPGQPVATNDGVWCVATRAVPDADQPVDGFADATFRSLFEQAITACGGTWAEFCSRLDRSLTYCFELTSPRAGSGVVHYNVTRTWLLAVRDTTTGEERCAKTVADALSVTAAPSHPASSLAELLTMIEARKPTEAEGVVLLLPGRADDGSFPRVKVKSAAYVAAHGISGEEVGASPRNLLRTILRGVWDDVGPQTRPHLRARGDALVRELSVWCAAVDAFYECLRDELETRGLGDNRKAFALAVKETTLPIAPLMARWTNQARDTATWLQQCKDKTGDWRDGFLDSLAQWLAVDAEHDLGRCVEDEAEET